MKVQKGFDEQGFFSLPEQSGIGKPPNVANNIQKLTHTEKMALPPVVNAAALLLAQYNGDMTKATKFTGVLAQMDVNVEEGRAEIDRVVRSILKNVEE